MEKRNIDQLFNERLQNYERKPRPEAWDKLQAKLHQNETKIVPLWWKVARAASVVLLLGGASYWVLNSEKQVETQVASNQAHLQETASRENAEVQGDLPKIQNSGSMTASQELLAHSIEGTKGNIGTKNRLPKSNRENVYNSLERSQDRTESSVAKVEPIQPVSQNNNTIVLVMEPSPEVLSPAKATETIVLSMVDSPDNSVVEQRGTVAWSEEINAKKTSKLGKLWQQLKKAKNGEGLDWKELGLKPQKVLARADAALENTKESFVESVREIKNNEK